MNAGEKELVAFMSYDLLTKILVIQKFRKKGKVSILSHVMILKKKVKRKKKRRKEKFIITLWDSQNFAKLFGLGIT